MRWSNRDLALAAGATTVTLLMTGCGATPSADPVESSTRAVPSTGPAMRQRVVETTYLEPASDDDGEETGPVRWDVVSARGRAVRVTLQTYSHAQLRQPDERIVLTWDGQRLLVDDSAAASRYERYDAPREHPDPWSLVEAWLSPPPASLAGRTCTRHGAERSIIGRRAVGYACHYAPTGTGDAYTDTVWVDRSTGTLLQQEGIKAQKLVETRAGASTFSTTPPAGARVRVVPARTPPAGRTVRAPDFTLVRSSGGRIASRALAGRPFVLAFFSADLAPDVADPSVRSVIDLQQLTRGGEQPRVLGVQVGERLAKRGMPLVTPRGVTLSLGYDEDALVENSFGLTSDVAFAFVRSDGTVGASFDRAATHAELLRSLADLR